MPEGIPTIDDVAAAARVSISTVSRVINKRPIVAEETRQRVLEAIQLLNFRPNALGRSLAIQSTATLGLVIGDITNPFYPEIVRAVIKAAAAYGMSVMLYETAEESEREAQALNLLDDRHVDGIIVCASRLVEERVAAMTNRETPIVLINRQPVPGTVGTIDADQEFGVQEAMQHLIALGHRRIAYIGGLPTSQVQHRRFAAFRAACAHYEIHLPDAYVVMAAPTTAGGKQAGRLLMEGTQREGAGYDERPSAIVAYNDIIAIGVAAAAQEAGMAVPGQLSIVGYDDISLAALLCPALTTVRQPMREMGEGAVHMVHAHLGKRADRPRDPIVTRLRPTLIVRSSTAAAAP